MTASVEAARPADGTRSLTVCLVGMPNSGKTTLMNALTGGHFHTANYPGVTVSLLHGRSRPEWGPPLSLVDLPGVHSAVNPSPEEEIACRVIESRDAQIQADAFVLVVDATQLERHLKFAGFVARQKKPAVIALTMTDLLPRLGQTLDEAKLGKALGLPVCVVDARRGQGIGPLVETVRQAALENPAPNALSNLAEDPVVAYAQVRSVLDNCRALRRDKPAMEQDSLTARIDRVVLDRRWGFPLFVVVLVALFASIFWLATPFMDAVDALFTAGGDLTTRVLPDTVLTRFFAEALIGGIGAVAVFLPQIVILFFLMTLLEDSGYLARGATLVDRPLSAVGLHGRSFVPMLSGFACAIPAVFASRSIPTLRERLLTVWIIPLMSCSARLPVYALLLAALLPGSIGWTGLSLAAIYIASLLIGSALAGVIGRLAFKSAVPSLLAMELPVYRVPRWKVILRMTWSRSSSYLRKAGGPIVVVAMVLWLLSNFGPPSPQAQLAGQPAPWIAASDMDGSFAAQLGRMAEPLLRPMGVDWRVGVGLISAFAAREVFVSAMAIVFHIEGEDEATQSTGLLEQMRTASFEGTGDPIFTTSSIVGLIVFFFFSLQCVSTVAVVRKETNSWRFAALQVLFYTGLGYAAGVGTVQGLRWMGVA